MDTDAAVTTVVGSLGSPQREPSSQINSAPPQITADGEALTTLMPTLTVSCPLGHLG